MASSGELGNQVGPSSSAGSYHDAQTVVPLLLSQEELDPRAALVFENVFGDKNPNNQIKWIETMGHMYLLEASKFQELSTVLYYEVTYGLDPYIVKCVKELFEAECLLGARKYYMQAINNIKHVRGLSKPLPPLSDMDSWLKKRTRTWTGYCDDMEHCLDLNKALIGYKARNKKITRKRGNDDDTKKVYVEEGEFPSDPSRQKELVKRLFLAMVNLEGILDQGLANKATAEGTAAKEWVPVHPNPATKYGTRVVAVCERSDIELELVAWKLLFEIKSAQEQGEIDVWVRDVKFESFPDFMARFCEVESSIKESKAMVAGCMESSFFGRLASAPAAELKRKVLNAECNNRKGAQQWAGRHAEEQGQVFITDDNEVQDLEGNVISRPKVDAPKNPNPRKRKTPPRPVPVPVPTPCPPAAPNTSTESHISQCGLRLPGPAPGAVTPAHVAPEERPAKKARVEEPKQAMPQKQPRARNHAQASEVPAPVPVPVAAPAVALSSSPPAPAQTLPPPLIAPSQATTTSSYFRPESDPSRSDWFLDLQQMLSQEQQWLPGMVDTTPAVVGSVSDDLDEELEREFQESWNADEAVGGESYTADGGTAADADHDEVFGNLGVYGADIIDGDGLFGYSFLMGDAGSEAPAMSTPATTGADTVFDIDNYQVASSLGDSPFQFESGEGAEECSPDTDEVDETYSGYNEADLFGGEDIYGDDGESEVSEEE